MSKIYNFGYRIPDECGIYAIRLQGSDTFQYGYYNGEYFVDLLGALLVAEWSMLDREDADILLQTEKDVGLKVTAWLLKVKTEDREYKDIPYLVDILYNNLVVNP